MKKEHRSSVEVNVLNGSKAKKRKVGVVLFALLLFFTILNFAPSSNMISLRKVELELGLPKPQKRFEEDRGEKKDFYGAKRTSRYIQLEYKETDLSLDNVSSYFNESIWLNLSDEVYDTEKNLRYIKTSEPRVCAIARLIESLNKYRNIELTIYAHDDESCKRMTRSSIDEIKPHLVL